MPQISMWHLLLALVAVLYALWIRLTQSGLAHNSRLAMNAWDQVVGVLSDPYLLCSFVLPLWLLRSAAVNHAGVEPQVMLRFGSRQNWMLRGYVRALVDALGFVAVLIAAGVATSFPLGWSLEWSSLTLDQSLADLTIHPIAELGISPPLVVVGQGIFLAVGLAGYATVLAVARLHLTAGVWQYALAALLWLWTLITFRTPTGMPIANLSDGLLLHLAAADYGSVAAGLVAVVWMPAAVLAQQVLVRPAERLRLPPARVLVLVVGSGCVVLLAVSASVSQTVAGVVFETLFAGAYGQTQLWRYAAFALLSLAPAWLYAARLNDVLQEGVYSELIRHRSTLTWWATRFGRWQLISMGFMTGVIVLIVLSVAAGVGNRSYDVPAPVLALQCYQYLVNGALQAAFYLLVLFLARWITGRESAPLVAAGLIMGLGIPPLNPSGWLPLMLNGIGYADYGWPTVLQITVQLAAADLFLAALTFVILAHSSRLRERNL
ncbi:hypothetical protein [Micropruina sp.]|uniref:hypothetical protein n=1 Tax=Micropruina sp. TaxID=2737536 RepID=UPI0039E2491B